MANTNQSNPWHFPCRSQVGILAKHSSSYLQSLASNLTCFPVVQAHCPLLPPYSTAKKGRCDLQVLFSLRLIVCPKLELFCLILYWQKGNLSSKVMYIYHCTSLPNTLLWFSGTGLPESADSRSSLFLCLALLQILNGQSKEMSLPGTSLQMDREDPWSAAKTFCFQTLFYITKAFVSLSAFTLLWWHFVRALSESSQKINVTSTGKNYKNDFKVHTFRNSAILVKFDRDIHSKKAKCLTKVLELEGWLRQPQKNSEMGH